MVVYHKQSVCALGHKLCYIELNMNQELTVREQVLTENARRDIEKYNNLHLTRGLDRYEETLPKYTQWGFWRRGVCDVIWSRSTFGRQAKVLDVGCGNGLALINLKSIYGSEVETWGISLSDFRTSSEGIDHYIIADIHDPKLKDSIPSNYFDCLIACQSFLHFGDPIQAL